MEIDEIRVKNSKLFNPKYVENELEKARRLLKFKYPKCEIIEKIEGNEIVLCAVVKEKQDNKSHDDDGR